jgi:hypothetical protein
VRDGELDRLDAREIGGVERVLAAGARLCFLPEHPRQRVGDRVERGDGRQVECPRAALEADAQLAVDESEEDHAGARLHLGHDAVEMRFRSHHRPEMAHHLDIVELRDRRLGDIFECLARGVGYEMKVEPAHRATMAGKCRKRQSRIKPGRANNPLWISFGISAGMISAGRIHPRACRFRSTAYPQGMNLIHRL